VAVSTATGSAAASTKPSSAGIGASSDSNANSAAAERLSAPEDIVNFAITHRVRARLALAEANTEAALRWARSAVAHASRTDWLEARVETTLGLARVLAALLRDADAVSEARAALESYAAKRHRPGVPRSRALLDELEARA
jgi:hypothetical protein